MTTFPEWLGQIGLAHCAQVLLENGIDFDVAQGLTESDLRSLGLNLGDSRRLLQALVRIGQKAAASTANAVATRHSPEADARPAGRAPAAHGDVLRLVAYTDLAQRLDPEELKAVIRDFRRACTKVVARYDGYVAQCLGDGVMVYFGWPAAHEDDAERPCARRWISCRRSRERWAPSALAVRIGIATGPVVVGEASRAAMATTGWRSAKRPTWRPACRDWPEPTRSSSGRRRGGWWAIPSSSTDLGMHALKGIVTPVHAWRVEGRAPGRGPIRRGAQRRDADRAVGRDEEMAMLQRHWQLARSGEGQVVHAQRRAWYRQVAADRRCCASACKANRTPRCATSARPSVSTPPSIQSSRTSSSPPASPATIPPSRSSTSWKPCWSAAPAQRTESAPLLAALLSLPTDRYPPLGLSPRRQKEKTLEVLVGQVEALSRIQPVLMVVEDAHWIDPTSQELLDVLVPRLRALRVLLVIYPPARVHRLTGREYPHVTTMTLTASAAAPGSELVGKVTRGKALPPEVLEQIVAHADGVPLFIEELTRSVLESRLLHEEDDRYTLVSRCPRWPFHHADAPR